MKKLLSIVSAFGLMATASTSVVSCSVHTKLDVTTRIMEQTVNRQTTLSDSNLTVYGSIKLKNYKKTSIKANENNNYEAIINSDGTITITGKQKGVMTFEIFGKNKKNQLEKEKKIATIKINFIDQNDSGLITITKAEFKAVDKIYIEGKNLSLDNLNKSNFRIYSKKIASIIEFNLELINSKDNTKAMLNLSSSEKFEDLDVIQLNDEWGTLAQLTYHEEKQ